MTAAELIELLKQFPRDAEVGYLDGNFGGLSDYACPEDFSYEDGLKTLLIRSPHWDAKRWDCARRNGLVYADRLFGVQDADPFVRQIGGLFTPGQVGDRYADAFIDTVLASEHLQARVHTQFHWEYEDAG